MFLLCHKLHEVSLLLEESEAVLLQFADDRVAELKLGGEFLLEVFSEGVKVFDCCGVIDCFAGLRSGLLVLCRWYNYAFE